MKRSSACVAGLLGFGGMLFLAGGTDAQGPAPGAAPPPAAAAQPTARPTIAVFNMAAVMRDYGKAKYQVAMLNKKRAEMSKDLFAWRAEYIKLQEDIQKTPDAGLKEQMGKKMLSLARQIEDKDREVNKALNDDATAIISQLYDDIKTVVDKTAEMNGYHIVFAYPDAVTKEEMNSAVVKELKLKPPAASPFFVAKHVDLTGVVVTTLNAWYPSPPLPKELEGNAAPLPGTPGAPPAPAPK